MYSHDTFGLGHLQRSLNVIRGLLARSPELSILLVTGSPAAHLFDLPCGADYVKLPAVRKVGSERYEARTLSMSDADVRTLRSNLLLRTARDYSPDVFLVDHAPVGMAGEVLPTLEWLRERGGCATLLGLRDIIDEPRSVVDLWNETGIYDVLHELYDHVLVYGSREIYDPVALYEFPEGVAAKTRFVHYVCDPSDSAGARPVPKGDGEPLVVVSIGGGDGGADEVIGTYLEMLRRFRADVRFRTEILTGPLLPARARQRFCRQAKGLPVAVRDFVPTTTPLFRQADLVVSTAGYNTTTQLLAHARSAVVIPRFLHRHEQLIRARRLAELGLATFLHPSEVEPDSLFEAVRGALGSPEEPLAWGRARSVVPLDGAGRVAEFFSRLLMARATSRDGAI